MNGQSLLIVTDRPDSAGQADAEVQATLEHWPASDRPPFQWATLPQAVEAGSPLDSAAVVWLRLDESADQPLERRLSKQLDELLGQVQDRHLPVLLTGADAAEAAAVLQQDGIVVCPPTADAAARSGMLQALWSQSAGLRELKTEVRLLRAQQGGLAGQIQRMDEELRLAAKLQREFLPRELPRASDVEFRVLWRPASYVSGDIYDISRLDENHVSFFVADAVGHGVSAALLTMYIKSAIRTKRIDPAAPRGYHLIEPSEALAALNHEMSDVQTGEVRFATACYGLINCATHELRIARAGHPFPILLRSNGQTEEIAPEGGLLGIFPDEQFDQVSLTLEPGDRLLVHSDGFEVAFPEAPGATPTGRRRMANTRYVREFEDLRHGSLENAVRRLEQKLDTQAGSLNQRDDLTILCLGVAGEPQTTTAKPQAVAKTA